MFNRILLPAFSLLIGVLTTLQADATIVSKMTISNLGEMQSKILSVKSTTKNNDAVMLSVFDWDFVISNRDGEKGVDFSKPFNFRDANTPNIIRKLRSNNVPVMILTARLAGMNPYPDTCGEDYLSMCIKPSDVQETAQFIQNDLCTLLKGMKRAKLGLDLQENSPFLPANEEACHRFKTKDGLTDNDYTLVVRSSIVLGGHFKGKALANLIDHNYFSNRPDTLFFIDDTQDNIDKMEKTFKDRPEKMYLFHYPIAEDKN